MKKKLIFASAIIVLFLGCDSKTTSNKISSRKNVSSEETQQKMVELNQDHTDQTLQGLLPESLFKEKLIVNGILDGKYYVHLMLQTLYLKADFNGDNVEDIAFPIKEIKSGKIGFAIIHGKTNERHIIGAGTIIKNGLSDDLDYIDFWEVSHEKEVMGIIEDENGELIETKPVILKSPGINITKTELGGGLIFWNGKEYEYLHQTC